MWPRTALPGGRCETYGPGGPPPWPGILPGLPHISPAGGRPAGRPIESYLIGDFAAGFLQRFLIIASLGMSLSTILFCAWDVTMNLPTLTGLVLSLDIALLLFFLNCSAVIFPPVICQMAILQYFNKYFKILIGTIIFQVHTLLFRTLEPSVPTIS